MKAYLINMHLLVPRSRSSAKVKVKYKGYIFKKNGHFGGIHVSQTHLVLNMYQIQPILSCEVLLQFCCGSFENLYKHCSYTEVVQDLFLKD